MGCAPRGPARRARDGARRRRLQQTLAMHDRRFEVLGGGIGVLHDGRWAAGPTVANAGRKERDDKMARSEASPSPSTSARLCGRLRSGTARRAGPDELRRHRLPAVQPYVKSLARQPAGAQPACDGGAPLEPRYDRTPKQPPRTNPGFEPEGRRNPRQGQRRRNRTRRRTCGHHDRERAKLNRRHHRCAPLPQERPTSPLRPPPWMRISDCTQKIRAAKGPGIPIVNLPGISFAT